MLEFFQKFKPKDVHDAFADTDLDIRGRIKELRAAGVPWDMIFAILIELIKAWLENRKKV